MSYLAEGSEISSAKSGVVSEYQNDGSMLVDCRSMISVMVVGEEKEETNMLRLWRSGWTIVGVDAFCILGLLVVSFNTARP